LEPNARFPQGFRTKKTLAPIPIVPDNKKYFSADAQGAATSIG
jgi:hypothetical protein